MKTTGERIRERRKEINMTADRLADILEVSRSTVFRYENGEIEKVPAPIMMKIASALNTTAAYLMGWEEEIIAPSNLILHNVYCETEDESELILSYRELSDIGKKKVSSYTDKLLEIETADLEVVAAHERTDIEVTDEMRQYDDDIMDDDNF